jgi:DNA-binding transcriptional LysR family regulator
LRKFVAKSTDAALSLRAIEVFVAALDEGSVKGAAKRLGASASAVSQQLSNLENVLGVRLIDRSAQRFSLTKAGEVFRPRALRILDEVSAAKASVSRSSAHPRMVVRVATLDDFDAAVLPHWLTRLQEPFTNLRFAIQSGPSHENHSELNGRAADMIIVVDTGEPAEWVEEHTLLHDPYLVITPANLPPGAAPETLLRRPFVRYTREQFMGRQIEAQLRRSKFAPPREHELSSNQAVFAMVAATGGWAITTAAAFAGTPMFAGDADGAPVLRAHPLPIPAFSRTLSLYARRDVLGDMPGQFAAALRRSLQEVLVNPCCNELPFLEGSLYVFAE